MARRSLLLRTSDRKCRRGAEYHPLLEAPDAAEEVQLPRDRADSDGVHLIGVGMPVLSRLFRNAVHFGRGHDAEAWEQLRALDAVQRRGLVLIESLDAQVEVVRDRQLDDGPEPIVAEELMPMDRRRIWLSLG